MSGPADTVTNSLFLSSLGVTAGRGPPAELMSGMVAAIRAHDAPGFSQRLSLACQVPDEWLSIKPQVDTGFEEVSPLTDARHTCCFVPSHAVTLAGRVRHQPATRRAGPAWHAHAPRRAGGPLQNAHSAHLRTALGRGQLLTAAGPQVRAAQPVQRQSWRMLRSMYRAALAAPVAANPHLTASDLQCCCCRVLHHRCRPLRRSLQRACSQTRLPPCCKWWRPSACLRPTCRCAFVLAALCRAGSLLRSST